MKTYRQGDLFIRRVGAIPKDAKQMKRESGRVVLAHGEATGHVHGISSPHCRQYAVADEFTKLGHSWIEVKGKGAVLHHEEHSPIQLPPGIFRVIRQRTYTPERLIRVAD